MKLNEYKTALFGTVLSDLAHGRATQAATSLRLETAAAELDRALWRPGFLQEARGLAEAFRAAARSVRRTSGLEDPLVAQETGVRELGEPGDPDPAGAARAARAALAHVQPGFGDQGAAGIAADALGLADGPWVDGLVAAAESGDRFAEGLIRALDPEPTERAAAAAYLARLRGVEPPTEH